MGSYNLTEEQKNLLHIAVKTIREQKEANSFLVSVDLQGADILGIPGRFSHNVEDNLLALAQADLITLTRVGQYSSRFSVKQSGFDAVDNDFILPQSPFAPNMTVGAIIHGGVSGGNVQAVGFSSNSELKQIINDPDLLGERIEEYLGLLIDSVKSDLTGRKLSEYIKETELLKQQLTSENPEPTVVQQITKSLAFMGDIEGTLALTAKAWPYVYPLIVMASELFKR